MLLLRATWYLRITSDISSAAPSDKSSYSHPTKGEQKCGKHPKLYVCSILLGPRNAGIRWRWYTIVYQYRDELTVPFPSCSAWIGVARIAATRSSLEYLRSIWSYIHYVKLSRAVFLPCLCWCCFLVDGLFVLFVASFDWTIPLTWVYDVSVAGKC